MLELKINNIKLHFVSDGIHILCIKEIFLEYLKKSKKVMT